MAIISLQYIDTAMQMSGSLDGEKLMRRFDSAAFHFNFLFFRTFSLFTLHSNILPISTIRQSQPVRLLSHSLFTLLRCATIPATTPIMQILKPEVKIFLVYFLVQVLQGRNTSKELYCIWNKENLMLVSAFTPSAGENWN